MSKKVFLVIGVLAVVSLFATLLFKNYLGTENNLSMGMKQTSFVGSAPPDQMIAPAGMGESMRIEQDLHANVMDSGSPGFTSYPYPYIAPSDALGEDNRVYLKYANHSVVVNNVSEYVSQLRDYFLSIEGRILNTSINEMDRYQVVNMTIKVPVEKFDEASMKVSSGVKKVVNESISTQDITGEIVSQDEEVMRIQAEIDEKEADLAELTENTAEWRRIRTQLGNLEDQLERMSKSAANYKENVMYATLSVTAAENERYFRGAYGYYGNRPDLAEIFDRAWWSAKGNIGNVLSALVWLAVYSIFWAPIVILIWWLKRRKSSTRKS